MSICATEGEDVLTLLLEDQETQQLFARTSKIPKTAVDGSILGTAVSGTIHRSIKSMSKSGMKCTKS